MKNVSARCKDNENLIVLKDPVKTSQVTLSFKCHGEINQTEIKKKRTVTAVLTAI